MRSWRRLRRLSRRRQIGAGPDQRAGGTIAPRTPGEPAPDGPGVATGAAGTSGDGTVGGGTASRGGAATGRAATSACLLAVLELLPELCDDRLAAADRSATAASMSAAAS